jgi:hypothetical protein
MGCEAKEEKGKLKRWPFNCPINTKIAGKKGLEFPDRNKAASFFFILFSFFP